MPRRNNMRGGNRIWNQNNDNRYNGNQFSGELAEIRQFSLFVLSIPRHF